MDHGYTASHACAPRGPSPAPTYLKQLAALRGNIDAAVVEAALREANVADLPRMPGASHVAADLMAFYFRGSEANDLCYRAAIGRDQCRALAGSDNPPPTLKGANWMRHARSATCASSAAAWSAAMLALKLSELRPNASVTVVEAGKRLFDLENRMQYRRRNLDYAENPWPGDFIEDQAAKGVISRTMAAGGSALHWGGTCNRFSEEDLRLHSMYGLAVDLAARVEGTGKVLLRSGAPPGRERRAESSARGLAQLREPYPMPAMTMTHNLERAEGMGREERHPVLEHTTGQEHAAIRWARAMHPLQYLLDLSHGRALFAGLHVQETAGAEELRTARSHAGAPPGAR